VNVDQDVLGLKADDAFKPFGGANGAAILMPVLVKLVDSFLVQLVRPKAVGPSLTDLADLIRATRLALRLLNLAPDFLVPRSLMEFEDAVSGAMILPASLQLPADRVQPVGFADLLVVKQKLLRYEPADIQRIENIQLGEKRGHVAKHSLTSEAETTTETEKTTETETSLTTADRSDLKTEIQSSLSETLDVKANLELGYGEAKANTWHFKATAGVQYTRVAQESSKFASEIAKDITQKASSKITERVKQVRRTKSTEILEDLEDKSFDNEKGTGHIRGVYQFLNKVYLAQVFNYDKHLLFDLNIPEPAAYLLEVFRSKAKNPELVPPSPLKWVEVVGGSTSDLNRPLSLEDDERALINAGGKIHDLAPDHLRPDTIGTYDGVSYTTWVAQYGVSGVPPSPEMYKSASLSHARDVQKDANAIVIEDQIQLPEGYEASGATVTAGWRHLTSDTESSVVTVRIAHSVPVISYDVSSAAVPVPTSIANPASLVLAQQLTSEGDVKADNFSAPPVTIALSSAPQVLVGAVPISISASKVDHVTVNVVVHCIRSKGWLRKWQLETYTQIVQRYNDLMDAYHKAQTAAFLANAEVGTVGRNTDTNRKTEQIELKRNAINILSAHGGQELLGKDATTDFSAAQSVGGGAIVVAPPVREPNLTVSKPIGDLVRFFEQAFEWDKIGYVFYPYFWARMDRWAERLQLTDVDPLFEDFLRAGYARVLLPVRRGFEDSVMYYLLWDEPWNGGDLPAIGDPLYLPITEEIRQRTGAPGSETPQGDPWEITVPTDLIYLRKDDALPEWSWVGNDAKVAALETGSWVFKERSNG
jgi:hypothetical protein